MNDANSTSTANERRARGVRRTAYIAGAIALLVHVGFLLAVML